jgi:hypothetical protein
MAGSAADPPDREEPVQYLWREPGVGAVTTTSDGADDADALESAAPSAVPPPPPRPANSRLADFDPWRAEAERERERQDTRRRTPIRARALLRFFLWFQAVGALAACCCGAAALLVTTSLLLRRLPRGSGPSGGALHCYASADPASLTICEVATGLGALSAVAWAGWVAHFLYESATAGAPAALAVRPRYTQMALQSVLALAWGATATGAVIKRPEADAAGMPFPGARAALTGLAPTAALLFLALAAADAAIVYFSSEGYYSGALRREGGIYCVMMTTRAGGLAAEEEEAEAEAARRGRDGQPRGVGVTASAGGGMARRRAPFGLGLVNWVEPDEGNGGSYVGPPASAIGSSLELF